MEKPLSKGREAASVTGAGWLASKAQTQEAPIAICTANAEKRAVTAAGLSDAR